MCPYFQQISKLPEADLILVPYNYILDRNIMQQFDIKVEKTILIFDEGHNLQQQAESIGSSEISSLMLGKCIDLVNQLDRDAE